MARIAVYKRVSTEEQDVRMQDHAIQEWLAKHQVDSDVVTFYSDLGISGKTSKRPGFQQLCEAVAKGHVDKVVVYRLDRLTRDAVTALQLLLGWLKNDIEFFATDQPALCASKDDPFRLTKIAMFSELAQIERETIVSRVKAGLAAARARGVRLGAESKLTAEQVQFAKTQVAAGAKYRDIARQLAVAPATVHRAVARTE